MKISSVSKLNRKLTSKRLQLLTGANSSGKSSIIYGLLGPLQSDNFPFQFNANGRYVNMGDFREIVYNHLSDTEIHLSFSFMDDNEGRIEITSSWEADELNNSPQLHALKVDSDYLKINLKKDEVWKILLDYDSLLDPRSQVTELEPYKKLNKLVMEFIYSSFHNSIRPEGTPDEIGKRDRNLKKLENYLTDKTPQIHINDSSANTLSELKDLIEDQGGVRLSQAYTGLITLFRTFNDKLNFISSFRLHPERTYLEKDRSSKKVKRFGEGYLDQIISWESENAPELKALIGILKDLEICNDIMSTRLSGGRYEILVQTNKNGAYTSLSDVGFGISQFLPILVADLQLGEDSTLVIAQPEIHLHPNVQALFADYIVDQTTKNRKRYVIETHSEYLLTRFRLLITKGELNEEDIAVYFITDSKSSKIHSLKFKKNGQILDAPANFFKTYMMDVMAIALNAE